MRDNDEDGFCEAAAEWDHDWSEDVCRECGFDVTGGER